ncbi:MAG: hypothetical protein ACRDAM_11730 [Casimicrobium sp.]
MNARIFIMLALLVLANAQARADVRVSKHDSGNAALAASAHLDFSLSLDRFISLSVGNGASVHFDLSSLIHNCKDAALGSCFGNGETIAAERGGVLPVSVKSNAGEVRITAIATQPLRSESSSDTIGASQIKIASSDRANLPAPQLVDEGASAPVSVNPTSFGGRVTDRRANWTFTYANIVSPTAGTYRGKIVFTATAF